MRAWPSCRVQVAKSLQTPDYNLCSAAYADVRAVQHEHLREGTVEIRAGATPGLGVRLSIALLTGLAIA